MKKIIATLLAAIMVFALCACGSSSSTATTAAGGTSGGESSGSESSGTAGDSGRYDIIKVAVSQDPEHLKPYNGNGNPKTYFYQNVYEALFDYDDENNLVPSIGKSITIVDSTHYQVEIYDCVYDSAGNHITADDVVYSINWLVDQGEAVKFEVFDSIEKVDDYTIEYTWAYEPSTWDDLEFPMTRCWIFSQAAMEASADSFATAPVATGPYVVKSYTAGSSLVLEANDDYWLLKEPEIMDTHLDLHRANVQTIEFDVIAEAAQAQIALEQGTVDYCEYIQTMAMDEFAEGGQYADKYTVKATEMGDYYYIYGNCTDGKITDDVNFRLACWNAIDSSAVAKAMGGDYAPMNTIGNSAFPDWDERLGDHDTIMNTCDLDKAKELLAKTDYNGEELILLCENTEAYQNAATMIQTQLAQIGVNIKINSVTHQIAESTQADPTAWDFSIASIGGSSLTGAYNRMLGNGVYEVDGQTVSIFFERDDELQSLYETAKADATHDYEHLQALIDYATEEQGYVYALAEMSTAVVCSNKITDLYIRETTYANFGASEYEGCTAEHSASVSIIEAEMPEPSELADNVHVFYQVFNPDDGAGIVWKLTVNDDESWKLEIKSTKEDIEPSETVTLTGDKTFPVDGNDAAITTTPPQEGETYWKENADWYEDDGVCQWELLDNNGMVPVNYEDYETYKADWASGDLQPIG